MSVSVVRFTQIFEHDTFIIYPMFRPFWPSSGRFYNNIHAKEFRDLDLSFTVNTLKYMKCVLLFPRRE